MAEIPTCLDEGQSVFLGSCIAGMTPPGMTPEQHAQACANFMWLADLPYCPGTTRLPIPECLSEEEVGGIDYCHYGDGSSPYWNALCWGAQKDPAWWQQYIATPPCMGVNSPLPRPQQVVPTTASDAAVVPPEEPDYRRRWIYAGIAAAVVVLVGGGIWYARRR